MPKLRVRFGSESAVGLTCYLCNQPIGEDDLPKLVGGQQRELVHGPCYFVHEASTEWRQTHPLFAPMNAQEAADAIAAANRDRKAPDA